MIIDYALVALLVFGLNLLPAFGPPTSLVLVFLTLSFDLAPIPLVLVGALAAAGGRFTLASGARRVRPRLTKERRESLAALKYALADSKVKVAAGLGVFVLSPVPSGQLFVAAGLMDLPLVRVTAAFFAGRLVSYSLYVSGASLLKAEAGDEIVGAITSPLGIALQLVSLGALVALLRVDWTKLLSRGHRSRRPPGGETQDSAPYQPRTANRQLVRMSADSPARTLFT